MSYSEFIKLTELAKKQDCFKRWMSKDAVLGEDSSPIELMILGTLRYLGWGWTFDDLYEATCIGEETHRQFFHVFIQFGSTVLFDLYVVAQDTQENVRTHMHEFNLAGFHGCVSSGNVTHVALEKCSHCLKQNHLSPKQAQTARTYNIVAQSLPPYFVHNMWPSFSLE
jgi:hypothetical protein